MVTITYVMTTTTVTTVWSLTHSLDRMIVLDNSPAEGILGEDRQAEDKQVEEGPTDRLEGVEHCVHN